MCEEGGAKRGATVVPPTGRGIGRWVALREERVVAFVGPPSGGDGFDGGARGPRVEAGSALVLPDTAFLPRFNRAVAAAGVDSEAVSGSEELADMAEAAPASYGGATSASVKPVVFGD